MPSPAEHNHVTCSLQASQALALHITFFFSFMTPYNVVQNPEDGSCTFLLTSPLVYQITRDHTKNETLSTEHRRVRLNNPQLPTLFMARILSYDGEPNEKSEKKLRPYCVQL